MRRDLMNDGGISELMEGEKGDVFKTLVIVQVMLYYVCNIIFALKINCPFLLLFLMSSIDIIIEQRSGLKS